MLDDAADMFAVPAAETPAEELPSASLLPRPPESGGILARDTSETPYRAIDCVVKARASLKGIKHENFIRQRTSYIPSCWQVGTCCSTWWLDILLRAALSIVSTLPTKKYTFMLCVYVYGSRLLRHMLVQPTKLEMACLLGREAFKKFQRTSRRLPVPPLRHNGRAASRAAAPWCGPRVVLPQAVLAVVVFGHLRCHRIRLRLGVLAFHIQGHRRISKPLAP